MPVLLLDLPLELRLEIYARFLADHQHVRRNSQPSNAHLRLLHTCSQIQQEAGPLFRSYISLLHEHQINAFIYHAQPALVAQIDWADVANDGRAFQADHEGHDEQEDIPLSNLHIALSRMTALRRLRVFQCRQGLPINLQSTMNLHRSRRLGLKFERAMFPKTSANGPQLASYELHLNPETRVDLFHAVNPAHLVSIRYSGEIHPQQTRDCDGATSAAPRMPALHRVVLHSITGPYFDRHSIEECFPGAQLDSFVYALGHRLGFEIRNHHLESLVHAHGARLQKLVLLGCSRLSSTVIVQCLESLPRLRHFALHMVTVDELRGDIVRAAPPTLMVLKMQVINAWYAIPLLDEERALCDAIEHQVLLRDEPFRHVCVCVRDKLFTEDDRQKRWTQIAEDRNFKLDIGPWEHQMVDEV